MQTNLTFSSIVALFNLMVVLAAIPSGSIFNNQNLILVRCKDFSPIMRVIYD